jgi:hypothetical protein
MNNMMLITSTWKDGKTFRLIPVSEECPYLECIYDVQLKVLAVISKEKKDNLHMVEKLDANGDPELRKVAKDGIPFKRERRTLETYQEYYLENTEEIAKFISYFAINEANFDYKQYLV